MPFGYSNKAADAAADYVRWQERLGLDPDRHLADIAGTTAKAATERLMRQCSPSAMAEEHFASLARSPALDLDACSTAGAISRQIEDSLAGAAERALSRHLDTLAAIDPGSLNAITSVTAADAVADLAVLDQSKVLSGLQDIAGSLTMSASLRALQETFKSAAVRDTLPSVLSRFESLGSTVDLNRALLSGHWDALDTGVAFGVSTALADYASLMTRAGLVDSEAFLSISNTHEVIERSLRDRVPRPISSRAISAHPVEEEVRRVDGSPSTRGEAVVESQSIPVDVIERAILEWRAGPLMAKLRQLVNRSEFSVRYGPSVELQWEMVPDLVCRLAFHYPGHAAQLAVSAGNLMRMFGLLEATGGGLRNGGIEYLSVTDVEQINDALGGFCTLLEEIEELQARQ